MRSNIYSALLLTVTIIVMGGPLCLYFLSTYFWNNVPVTIYVNGKTVYKGPSACAQIDSRGNQTQLKILKMPYCFFPKAYYVSENIKVEGVK